LLEHLVAERNLAPNTQKSYRDTLALLLPYVAKRVRRSVDKLHVEDLSADAVRSFLLDIERSRRCAVSTRNQRLAAIHALARFVGDRSPVHVVWCGELRRVPFKKGPRPVMDYLEKAELDALLKVPARNTGQGRRDYALLLFLYNSGARASEAADLTIENLSLERPASVRIIGKGRKVRRCPLWDTTVDVLAPLIEGRASGERVFMNRRKQPMTRFGVHALVRRCARAAAERLPALRRKRVSTHTIRHTTAMHLLRAGVDINTIRAWLGHVSLDTTNVYAEVDLEMKAKALASCETGTVASSRSRWKLDRNLMAFLKSL
jgi:site-specific recombinase XerD